MPETTTILQRFSDYQRYEPVTFTVSIQAQIIQLGKNPIKWRQRSDINIAFDWDVKHQFKKIKQHGVNVPT